MIFYRWPIFCFSIIMISFNPLFGAYELGGNFSYNKSVYGQERQNKLVSRSYTGSFSIYFSARSALEFNYSHRDDITTENNVIPVTQDISIVGSKNVVNREVYGIGLRQFFARRNAPVRPSLSLGYAKQFVTDETDVRLRDEFDNTAVLSAGRTRRREDSVFGGFSMQFRLGQKISLDASVNTVFKAFEFNRAGDNLRYSLGLRWFFI